MDTHRRERARRLLRALYREEFRASAYRVYRSRAAEESVRKMLGTFLRAEDRMIGLLEGHLSDLGAGTPGRPGLMRRTVRFVGAGTGLVTSLGGARSMLRRVRSEEERGAEHYGREAHWAGWSQAERETLEGHHCDQLYQNRWAEEVAENVREGRA